VLELQKIKATLADGCSYVAQALLPVILALVFDVLQILWTAAALGCVLLIFVWILQGGPVWTAAKKKTQRLIANG